MDHRGLDLLCSGRSEEDHGSVPSARARSGHSGDWCNADPLAGGWRKTLQSVEISVFFTDRKLAIEANESGWSDGKVVVNYNKTIIFLVAWK